MRSGRAGPVGDHRWGRPLLAIAAAAGLFWLVVILPRATPPEPVAVRVVNTGPVPVLVDARWWGGNIGIDGPVAMWVGPESATVLTRADGRKDICVRVVDRGSGRIVAWLVPPAGRDADTLDVEVAGAGADGVASMHRACPSHLQEHRVRVAAGRYFDPGDPASIRRERMIRRF